MSCAAVGVGGGLAIAGGVAAAGSIGGALISSHAAGEAADKQAAAATYAADLQHQQYEEQRSDQAPWRAAGGVALSQMGDPSFQHNFGISDFQKDPGYDFRMQEGQKALERSAAARGGLMNGGTLKALTGYAQGMASDEYQNAYNRFTNDQTNRFNRLSSVAGLGQTANAQLGQAGMNYANQAGEARMNSANAQGAAGIAGANAWSNSLSGLGNLGMQGYMINRFAPQQLPAGGGYSPNTLGSLSGGGDAPYTYNSTNFGSLGG